MSTRLVLGFLVLLASAACASAQNVDLRPRWEKGAEHRFRIESSNTMGKPPARSSGPGNRGRDEGDAPAQSVKQDMEIVFRVIDAVPEKDAIVELAFDRVKVAVDAAGEKDEYDSTKPGQGGGGAAGAFKSLAGLKLTLTIDPNGNITSVKPAGGAGATPSDPMVAGLTGADAMKDLIGPIFTLKKGGGIVRAGQSWENVDEINSGLIGKVRVSTKHTVRSANARDATVAIDGRVDADSESPAGLVQIRDGKFTGSYSWGVKEGMLRSMENRMSFTVQIGSGGDDLGLLGDMAVEQRTKVTRLDRPGSDRK
ncbi:MAG: DUF6263 family protein [Phycisphaerales bacterium]